MLLASIGGIIVLLLNIAIAVFLWLIKADFSSSGAMLVSLGVMLFGLRIIELGFIYSRVKKKSDFTCETIKTMVFFENTWLVAFFCLTCWAFGLGFYYGAFFLLALLTMSLPPVIGRNFTKQKIFAGEAPPESIASGETLLFQIRRPLLIAGGIWLLAIIAITVIIVFFMPENPGSLSRQMGGASIIAVLSIFFIIFIRSMVMKALSKLSRP
jgi:hypothetical protein